MSLIFTLAARNLFHDRLRFVATLIGIVFSIVLVMVQLGLYFGFGQMVTTMIDHAAADLWVVSTGTKSFEDLTMLDSGLQNRIAAVDGVAETVPMVIGFAEWQLSGGATTPVFVVGANTKLRILRPWNVAQGTAALDAAGAVAVDRSYFGRLGVTGLGSTGKIRGQNVHVAGVTTGIRSFTTTPYVFADLDHARAYLGLPADRTSHFMVRLKPGADRNQVQKAIDAAVPGVRALTPAEFEAKSRSFWLYQTGAGAALFAGALLGVIVGTVIVAQTLYSSTKDHWYEFATLRAIGCSQGYIYRVILNQALVNAVIGFGLAAAIGYAVVHFTASTALPIMITPVLALVLFALTIVMCVASGLVSIVRVIRLDPVIVLTR